jgi:hypothetical protein
MSIRICGNGQREAKKGRDKGQRLKGTFKGGTKLQGRIQTNLLLF